MVGARYSDAQELMSLIASPSFYGKPRFTSFMAHVLAPIPVNVPIVYPPVYRFGQAR